MLRSEAESALRKRRTPEEYEHTLSIVMEEATRLGVPCRSIAESEST
ncbi:MAG: hypothetical protein AB7I48_00010 [Planctomycetaceae bacterium]